MRRIAAILTLVLAMGPIAACSGGSPGSTPPTIISGSIAYFIVLGSANRDTVQMLPGNHAQLSGVTYDVSLDALALVGDTLWVSRNPAVASVDTHGLVTSLTVGTTWVVGSFQPANSQSTYADSVWINVIGVN